MQVEIERALHGECILALRPAQKKVNYCNQERNNSNINKHLKMQPPPVEELALKNISFHKSETAAPCLNATPTS